MTGLQPLRYPALTIPFRGETGFSTYFITFNIFEKRHLLQSYGSAELLIDIVYRFRKENRYLIQEFVVMPNHFHGLLTPLRPVTVERCVGMIKGAFSYEYSRIASYRGRIWQTSFMDRRVRDFREYQTFRAYIHENPVKKHLAGSAAEFPFGSASGKFELDDIPQWLKPVARAALAQA